MLPLEAVIEHFLPWLFPGMEIGERALFRVTRDADFEVSDEADDLLEAVELEVRRRRFGEVVRLEVSEAMSRSMLDRLSKGLDVDPEPGLSDRGMLDLADLMEIATSTGPISVTSPGRRSTQPRLAPHGRRDLFAEIRSADLLVHLPYDSFATSVEAFVRSAVKDPDVIGIKSTVYRTSEDSPVVPALIEAAEAGKQSVCLVELKARFDEHRNIEWSRALEQAGVHVVYGYPNLKIHAKTTLVVRREGDMLRRYVHIGTGNYHARTARLYEDFGLFTADEDIASRRRRPLQPPDRLRPAAALPQAARRAVQPAQSADRGDPRVGAAAARASAPASASRSTPSRTRRSSRSSTPPRRRARRSTSSPAASARSGRACPICRETISVRSVVGRFLEHSRVFHFEAGDRPPTSSAAPT